MPIARLSLTPDIQSRKADPSKDAKMVNAYKEGTTCIKRPGLKGFSTTPGLPTAVGQGVYHFNDDLYAGVNNTLYKITTGGTATTIGSITGDVVPLSFVNTFNNNYLFFHNYVNGYTINSTGTLTKISNDQLASITLDTVGASYESNPAVIIGGSVKTLSLDLGGSGYVTAPAVDFSPPDIQGGAKPTATALIVAGVVVDVILDTPGFGYLTAPVVTIDPPPSGTTALASTTIFEGTGATATCTVVTGVVQTVTITNIGTGYLEPPSVNFVDYLALTTTAASTDSDIEFASTENIQVGWAVSGTGVPVGTVVTEILNASYIRVNKSVSVASGDILTLTSGGAGATATSTLNFFPTDLVPGVAYIDTYTVVQTKSGRIYNSNPGVPTVWGALDYISATAEPDQAVGLAKHLNYVVSFGQWSTEFFYDAAVTTGSPFLRNEAARIEIGCANGESIVQFEQTLVWVGKSNTAGKSVYMLDGLSPTRISNPFIDRYLDADGLTNCTASSVKYNGHAWYILTLPDSNLTLVGDLTEKTWYFWSSVYNNVEQYFVADFATSLNGITFMQDSHDGELYTLDSNTYTDADGVINFRIVTELLDADSHVRKFVNRVEIIGDKVDSVLRVKHTDDDYQSWSIYRSVNLKDTRPVLYQNGSARRRAFELFNNDDAPIRLFDLELDVTAGVH